MSKYNLLLINGPNLQLLGKREPEIYGSTTLKDVEQKLTALAEENGATLSCFQSNHEGDIVDCLGEAFGNVDGIIINPAAYTHTSVAIRDALSAVNVPTVEVHISNIHKREEFRHHSYMTAVSLGMICGMGIKGYELALTGLLDHLAKS